MLLPIFLESALALSEHCRPRLYVYRLPEAYRDPQESLGGLPPDGLGRPLHLRDVGIQATLWDAEQYSAASLLHERSLSYRCRTHDPADADLFFVPAFKSRLAASTCAEKSGKRGLTQRLRLELPNASRPTGWPSGQPLTTLEARGGADHIVINPRNGASWERAPYCELTYGSPVLGAALHLAFEQGPRNGSRWVYPEGYCGQVCVDAYYPQLLAEPIYWSTPWTSLVHLGAHAGHTPPWASAHARPVLVAAHFGTQHKPILPKPTMWLRERLLKQCHAAGPERCRLRPPNAKQPEATAQLYWEATFCLQPGGDSISRKGIVDALLLGCIPVLFHTGQLAQWPWHWGAWVRSASVLLKQSAVRANKLDAIDYLARLPAATVSSLQAAIRRHAHRMHYAAVDTSHLPAALRSRATPDAFEVLLEGAWRLARDQRLQTLGRHLQRTRAGGAATLQRRVKLAAALAAGDDAGESRAEHGAEQAASGGGVERDSDVHYQR